MPKSTAGAWGTRLLFAVWRDVAHGAAALAFRLLHLGLALGHALDEALLVAGSAGFEFRFGDLAHEPCLADGEDVLSGPVEGERGGEVIAKEEEHEWHEHDDLLLHRVAGLGRHADLQEARNCHHDGQDVERQIVEER